MAKKYKEKLSVCAMLKRAVFQHSVLPFQRAVSRWLCQIPGRYCPASWLFREPRFLTNDQDLPARQVLQMAVLCQCLKELWQNPAQSSKNIHFLQWKLKFFQKRQQISPKNQGPSWLQTHDLLFSVNFRCGSALPSTPPPHFSWRSLTEMGS